MDVVCTAGHVDHGKSTLVRALTGMEPDRFAEEQRRGLTIDLGFAWTTMSWQDMSATVAFVDLPGHERFVANMLAGAGPVESTLFVVAADEGWKAQSQEHLEILDVLGVEHGVVAITKTDAADGARISAVRDEITARLRGTTLAAATVVEVSAASGDGLDDLRAALLTVLARRAAPAADGRPRLWIDRAFTIKGAGTVVTGTLTGGVLRVGDDVAIRPGTAAARIRGLESLQEPVDMAAPGDRVAVNLAGVDRAALGRGQLLTATPAAAATTAADVWLRTLDQRDAGRRGAWHLHAGSGRWNVGLRPYGETTITGDGFARVLFDPPAPVQPGDRFVLRDAGSRSTVGGGVVLDAAPPPLRGAAQRGQRRLALESRKAALAAGDRGLLLALHVRERGAADAAAAATQVGLTVAEAAAAAKTHGLLGLGDAWADPAAAAAWGAAVGAEIAAYHRAHPLDRSAPRAVALRAATGAGCPDANAGALVTLLLRLGRIVAEGTGVRHPDHGVALSSADQQTTAQLLAALDAQPLAPPRLSDAVRAASATPALVRELEARGDLVRLGPDLAVTGDALRQAEEILRACYATNGPLTAAEAKNAWGTSRKYALPLLEELDRRGITRRNGDVREVL